MAKQHPHTGETLVRGGRTVTLELGPVEETFEMPGWYPEDDPTYTRGVLTKKDQRSIDFAVTRLLVKYVEAKGITIVSGKDGEQVV